MRNLYLIRLILPLRFGSDLTIFNRKRTELAEHVNGLVNMYDLTVVLPNKLWLSPEELTVITLQLPTDYEIIRDAEIQ